ncbi:serine hydrolase [Alsobacter sp. SYSU M60028]|uniref:Serine hydrolase n=1 Tax=Alsobacter ponti TaxID=2962936 RepID=A0ABT1LGQ7_9HYPH|nr:serine hydrolase [Alsobacter ponti]MCP8940687.1 serine hydrolase [Alsobacter ponti]
MTHWTDRTTSDRAAARSFLRPFLLALGACLIGTLVPAASNAATPYVVAEVESGRVLMQEDATMPWYPASVTKLMTAYVALKQMRAGAISPDTPIPVSTRAASAPPSKIGARPGTEITLDNALKMMLVKSANDIAVVVAEGVGGSVEAFAEMMNREAAAIGMRESRFVNPNGLFIEGQQTSARDMALLARAILLDFPEHADLFSIGAVQLGPKIMRNTNGLVGRYPGIEGMKTGFICASGFNLVAVASRNGRRIVAVVFGQPTAADRTIKAAALLDKGFNQSGGFFGGTPLDALPHSSVAAPPNVREDVCVRRKGPPASEEELETAAGQQAAVGDGFNMLGPVPQLGGLASVMGSKGPRSLAARAESDPIPVFLGRAPGSATAPLAANAPRGVKPPATATAYASGKSELDETQTPVVGGAAGPLTLKPAANLPLRGQVPAAAKVAPVPVARAATGPVPAMPAKAALAPPVAKSSGKAVAKPAAPTTTKAAAKAPASTPAKAVAKASAKPTAKAPAAKAKLETEAASGSGKPLVLSPPAPAARPKT